MLVLTRKLMERLYIGGDICVTVVRLEGSQVRLGIEAPRHIPVVRAELTRHPRPAEPVEPNHQADEPQVASNTRPRPTAPSPRPVRMRARPSGPIGLPESDSVPPAARTQD